MGLCETGMCVPSDADVDTRKSSIPPTERGDIPIDVTQGMFGGQSVVDPQNEGLCDSGSDFPSGSSMPSLTNFLDIESG